MSPETRAGSSLTIDAVCCDRKRCLGTLPSATARGSSERRHSERCFSTQEEKNSDELGRVRVGSSEEPAMLLPCCLFPGSQRRLHGLRKGQWSQGSPAKAFWPVEVGEVGNQDWEAAATEASRCRKWLTRRPTRAAPSEHAGVTSSLWTADGCSSCGRMPWGG